MLVEIGTCSDVKRVKVGDAVYTSTFVGTLTEYLVVGEEFLALKPSNQNFDEAAAVPSVALAAYCGMTSFSKVQKSETVLILGGSSAVGMFAIQFAKDIGARVIATTGTRNVDLIKSLGADQVVDYTKEKWVDVLALHSVDVVYDCGVEPMAWNNGAQLVLKQNTGRILTLVPMMQPTKESEFGAQLIGFVSFDDKSAETLAVIAESIKSVWGEVKPTIDTIYPFEKALDAYEKLKTSHAQGKLVILVQP